MRRRSVGGTVPSWFVDRRTTSKDWLRFVVLPCRQKEAAEGQLGFEGPGIVRTDVSCEKLDGPCRCGSASAGRSSSRRVRPITRRSRASISGRSANSAATRSSAAASTSATVKSCVPPPNGSAADSRSSRNAFTASAVSAAARTARRPVVQTTRHDAAAATVTISRATVAMTAMRPRCRPIHFRATYPRDAGLACTGRPFSQRSRSSINADVVAYLRFGSRSMPWRRRHQGRGRSCDRHAAEAGRRSKAIRS